MNTKLDNAIDSFLDDDVKNQSKFQKTDNDTVKKEILNTRSGLIERVDKIYLTEDGRQLLREQY